MVTIVSGPQVILPQGNWIPDRAFIGRVGMALLSVAGAALDQTPAGELYTLRRFTHAQSGQVTITPGGGPQLIVSCGKVFIGRPGQQRYQSAGGVLGTEVTYVGTFYVDVVRPWPYPDGGWSPGPPESDETVEAAWSLGEDALGVWATMQALALGGVVVDPPIVERTNARNILMSPLEPKGPEGGMAGWGLQVDIPFN